MIFYNILRQLTVSTTTPAKSTATALVQRIEEMLGKTVTPPEQRWGKGDGVTLLFKTMEILFYLTSGKAPHQRWRKRRKEVEENWSQGKTDNFNNLFEKYWTRTANHLARSYPDKLTTHTQCQNLPINKKKWHVRSILVNYEESSLVFSVVNSSALGVHQRRPSRSVRVVKKRVVKVVKRAVLVRKKSGSSSLKARWGGGEGGREQESVLVSAVVDGDTVPDRIKYI